MWERCTLDGKDYLVKHDIEECVHNIYITNAVYLWYEEIEQDKLLQRCKEMNRLLEASDTELLNLVRSLVEGGGHNIISSFTDIANGKQLNLQSSLEGLKFKMKFVLQLADPCKFFEKFSCSLLITITELEKRQRLLTDIIKKKDLEIAEYKLEGAKISRGAVETQVFEPEVFLRQRTEELGTTKSLVQAHPCKTFTTFIRQLVENTENAPVIPPREISDLSDRDLQTFKRMRPIKIKSPKKVKRTKIYDEEDESDHEDVVDKKEDANLSTGKFECKQKSTSKSSKEKAKHKVKEVLSNL